MNEATVAITVMSFLLFAIFLGFFIWAIKSGQFKNVEEAKFHIFRNEGQGSDGNEKTGEVDKQKEEGV
ncbi:MAG: cbb3-type cytochrome oxidase assembly protein [Chloroflexota bacterium]